MPIKQFLSKTCHSDEGGIDENQSLTILHSVQNDNYT